MPRINCRIIPEPQEGTRPIYKKNGSKIEPFIVGKGDIDYICGRCDAYYKIEIKILQRKPYSYPYQMMN